MTITGPGGIGKTTVALAVADRLQAEHADGVVFADLSPVPAEADVTRAVAEAAGVEGAAAETIERVADNLAHQSLLLVLDNCEHVLERSAELVDRMLERGDTAHVLATSREPLRVVGEHVWPLGPLHEDGPALFVERALAAEPPPPQPGTWSSPPTTRPGRAWPPTTEPWPTSRTRTRRRAPSGWRSTSLTGRATSASSR